MKKYTSDYGTIEYRLPNAIEGIALIGDLGLTANDFGLDAPVKNEFHMLAEAVKAAEKFITKIELEIEGEKITTYDAMCNKMEMMEALTQIGGELINCLGLNAKKKS
jgi:hypothetical protein